MHKYEILPRFFIHPQDFIYNILGYKNTEKISNLEERLETYIWWRLKRSHVLSFRQTNIKTKVVTRRSDIETFTARYEVKSYLDRESILSALSQLVIYHHYGSKVLGIFPKKSVIIGLSPIWSYDLSRKGLSQYITAKNTITDIQAMAYRMYGIRNLEIIFINESKFFCYSSKYNFTWRVWVDRGLQASSIITMIYFIISLLF